MSTASLPPPPPPTDEPCCWPPPCTCDSIKSRPFTYLEPGTDPLNSARFGSVIVGLDNLDISGSGLTWFSGPSEEFNYIIAHDNFSNRTYGNNTGPIIGTSIGFWKSIDKTEESLVSLANIVTGQNFTSGSDAKSWLQSNGYWTSYPNDIIV